MILIYLCIEVVEQDLWVVRCQRKRLATHHDAKRIAAVAEMMSIVQMVVK